MRVTNPSRTEWPQDAELPILNPGQELGKAGEPGIPYSLWNKEGLRSLMRKRSKLSSSGLEPGNSCVLFCRVSLSGFSQAEVDAITAYQQTWRLPVCKAITDFSSTRGRVRKKLHDDTNNLSFQRSLHRVDRLERK